MFRHKALGRLVTILSLLCAHTVALPAPARADVWAQASSLPVSDMRADRAWAVTGGSVLADCSPPGSASTSVLRFVADTAVQANWAVSRSAATRPEPCDIRPAFGSDSSVYLPATTNSKVVLAAYHATTPTWQRTLPHDCGSIYALATAKSRVYALLSGCAQGNNYLWGVNQTTGAAELETALGISLPGTPPTAGLAAYTYGLVLLHATGIQHISYSGVAQPAITVPNMLLPRQLVADTAGRVWLPIKAATAARQACGASDSMLGRLESYSPAGKIAQSPAINCTYAHTITMTADGGALVELWPYGTASTASHHLVSLTPAGTTRWTLAIPEADSYGHKPQLRFTATQHGDIVLTRNTTTAAGRKTMRVELRDHATSALLEPAFNYAAPTTDYTQTDGTSLPASAPGTLYLPLQSCNGTTCTTSLHRLQRTELTWAYPGQAVAAPDTGEAQRLEYVALGDSFSSGEGAPPFIPGTDVRSGEKNICHRSAQAYPQLLMKNQGLNLDLKWFGACSGATTSQIHHGWPEHRNKKDSINLKELPQAERIEQSTDLVTLTIGGNDVGFATVVTQCVLRLCEFAIDNAYDKLAPATLSIRLRVAYQTIRNRMGPHTKVLVLGYPALLPPKRAMARTCQWGQLSKLTSRQVQALRRLGDSLNRVIAQETARAGFVYVPNTALNGHELCTAKPYINPVRIYPRAEYSVHPNALGHQAIARLLAGKIKKLYTTH